VPSLVTGSPQPRSVSLGAVSRHAHRRARPLAAIPAAHSPRTIGVRPMRVYRSPRFQRLRPNAGFYVPLAGSREFFKLSKSDRKLSPEIVVQQTNTFHLLLILLDKSAESGEKFTHSMALQMLKIRSRRSAIEMATNEDKSHLLRERVRLPHSHEDRPTMARRMNLLFALDFQKRSAPPDFKNPT
jgi:hypothetical protein